MISVSQQALCSIKAISSSTWVGSGQISSVHTSFPILSDSKSWVSFHQEMYTVLPSFSQKILLPLFSDVCRISWMIECIYDHTSFVVYRNVNRIPYSEFAGWKHTVLSTFTSPKHHHSSHLLFAKGWLILLTVDPPELKSLFGADGRYMSPEKFSQLSKSAVHPV